MKAKKYTRSPIFYMGNKHKLLKQIIPLFPKNIENFYDLFGGGGVVTINVEATNKYYNDIDDVTVGLVKMVGKNNVDELDKYFKGLQDKYNLEDHNVRRSDATDDSWFDKRKANFKRLRDDYNNSENKDIRDLYFLICYSINHLIRFNSKGEFNASSGNDCYSNTVCNQLKNMNDAFKNVKITQSNYSDIEIKDNSFVYLDPPYENTTKYGNNTFNHEEFWNWVRDVSKTNTVVVSEYNAPDDFKCIWEKEHKTSLDVGSQKVRVEKMFVYDGE